MATATTPDDARPLFDPSIIPESVISSLPEGYTIRPLRRTDYDLGFLDCLAALTVVGEIAKEDWQKRYDYMASRDGYHIVVVEDAARNLIVGSGTLIVERKFIRELGSVGHIEDIVVAKDQQGKKFGLRIIETLDSMAQTLGCYKCSLYCKEMNEGFYAKCGFKRAEIQMTHRF